jgi:molybdopterin-guanine dinucleotide biosynthesis protein
LLGETLARLASSRGLRVWVVKHVHHGVDYRVKDTGRYLAAGAERVYAIGPGEYMLAIWHEAFGEQKQKITVGVNGLKDVTFTYQPGTANQQQK